MGRAWIFPVIVAGLIASMVALVGMTITDLGPWYRGLVQPRWAPPEAAYGVAWTAIYALTALAGVTAWLATPTWREKEWLIGLFALNGFLNILWSLLFFRMHRPDLALIEVIFLWLSVAALILVVWRRSMGGALLLVPYLMWVTFAGYLNLHVVRLNGPSTEPRAVNWLFDSGHAVDIVLAVILVEFVWLIGKAKWPPIDAALRLLPGALILFSLRFALTGSDWRWVALFLLLSLPVHLADVARRPGGEG